MGDWLERLPHREPFLFLTWVVEVEPGIRGQAVWAVSGSEGFFAGHFPGEPVVPGVLISEALAQLSGLVGLHGEFGGGRLVHVDIRFDGAVRPPAEIVLSSKMVRAMGALRQFEVEARVGDRRVTRGMLALAGVEA